MYRHSQYCCQCLGTDTASGLLRCHGIVCCCHSALCAHVMDIHLAAAQISGLSALVSGVCKSTCLNASGYYQGCRAHACPCPHGATRATHVFPYHIVIARAPGGHGNARDGKGYHASVGSYVAMPTWNVCEPHAVTTCHPCNPGAPRARMGMERARDLQEQSTCFRAGMETPEPCPAGLIETIA